MTACYDKRCQPVPEDPALLQGPEVGVLVRYHPRRGEDVVARVLARSYVWSPEQHRSDGYHGFRHYDWTVIEYGRGHTLVVDDDQLTPLELGEVLAPKSLVEQASP